MWWCLFLFQVFSLSCLTETLAVFNFTGCKWENVTTLAEVNYIHDVSACYNRAVSESMSMKIGAPDLKFTCPKDGISLSFNDITSVASEMRESLHQFVFVGDSVLKQQAVVFGCMIDPQIDFNGCIRKLEAQQKSECHVETMNFKLHLFKIGKKFNSNSQLEKILRGFNASRSTVKLSNKDFVVVNQGLHHSDGLELEELKSLASAVVSVQEDSRKSLTKEHLPTVIWRETTPQHYPTCNGWYESSAASVLRKEQCVTTLSREMNSGFSSSSGVNCSFVASTRNDLTNPIMEAAGIAVSRVYEPLVNTSGNFHLHSPLKRDCTHYQVFALIFMNQMLLSLMKGR